jgi:hypothetical protein
MDNISTELRNPPSQSIYEGYIREIKSGKSVDTESVKGVIML